MTTPREFRKWKLRKFKDTLRIRMPRRWMLVHKPTGLRVGWWRDKGAAHRWMRSSPEWRVQNGTAGPSGWDLRLDLVQYSIN